jgi:hypothetical protein
MNIGGVTHVSWRGASDDWSRQRYKSSRNRQSGLLVHRRQCEDKWFMEMVSRTGKDDGVNSARRLFESSYRLLLSDSGKLIQELTR